MRTATFFEALASAAARPGEKWRRKDTGCLMVFKQGLLMFEDESLFVVTDIDLTATWVCETEGKDGE